jgi:hypothetical protein
MPPKRSSTPGLGSSSSSVTPAFNAFILILVVSYGLWLLVERGSVAWPPTDLLRSLYTLSGCFALAGPVILARRENRSQTGGLGELAWLTAGLLLWFHNFESTIRGGYQSVSWATPVEPSSLGITILAVMGAGWRLSDSGREWTWTNVVGWLLGLLWIGLGLGTLLYSGRPALGLR